MRIIIIISFLIFLGLLFATIQVPTLDNDKVKVVIKEVIDEAQVTPETESSVEEAAILIVDKLESAQRRRLKFLVSAYLVIWLVFMLYLLRLGKQQQILDRRISQFEEESVVNSEESVDI